MINIGDVLFTIKDHKINEFVVERVGRMYFTLKGVSNRKYNIKTLKYTNEQYSRHDKQLYRTKQEILDQEERSKIVNELKFLFRDWRWSDKLNIEELKNIKEIVTKNP